ncbi:MAG TPA: DUF4340 domain-containing protein [bacterium]|nr:DUF4340 domain-containing protein [bacterium]
MKLRVLVWMAGVLLVLAVGAFALNRWITAPGDMGRVGQVLMTGVDPADVARIQVISPEHTVTLNSTDGSSWTVAEQQDFPVDTKKIKRLFLKLTTLTLDHKVSDEADKLGVLGVLTKEENGGKLEKGKTGKLIRISDKSGKPLFSLVIGNDRQGQGAMTFGGTYVRYPGDNAVYLISDSVVVDLRPADWIDTVVLDVEADKMLKSVRVQNAGQRAVEFSRDKAGAPWSLAGLPAAELNTDQVKRLTNQLAGLDVYKVAAGDTAPAVIGRKRLGHVEFEFFDKRRFTMDVGDAKAKDEFRYISIHAALDPSVKDASLQDWVKDFNQRYKGRLLGIYDWDASRILQPWKDYKKKPAANAKK